MKMKNVFFINASLILLLLAACSAINPTPVQVVPTPTATEMPKTGVQYQFVTNKLIVPTTQDQTKAFALNVDGDSKKTLDNKFGELLTLLTAAAPNLELQATLDQAINTGQLISLHMVKADDFMNDSSVSWSIFLGQRTAAAPNFDGLDKFTLDSASPPASPIVGSVTNGHFSGGPGTAQVQLFLLGQQVEVGLVGLRLETDFSAKGCVDGKLGGGVTVEEFRGKLLPAIADGLNLLVKTNNVAATPLLQAFDSDNNNTITLQELENNPLLMIAIAPDLDLLDASGKFNPGLDGVKDSYSAGFGFTCLPANFNTREDVLVP
ncbi:MAG: hypothetical protein IPO22_07910 [Anaerolineales bacterium]|jgi:hypothetical protein|nr:hypothetical protein [Anaerolineales bacterium]